MKNFPMGVSSIPFVDKYFDSCFDCDVSDCCIGRFQTSDPTDVLIKEFDKYVDYLDNTLGYEGSGPGQSREIPLKALKGWISF